MKQPELGRRITELRKEQNLTQEDLVEKCNVNVRTLQRIESGEVTPRPSTLRIITEALGMDYKKVVEEENNQTLIQSLLVINASKKQLKSVIQIAWIAGLIYFALGLVEASTDYLLLEGNLDITKQIFFVAVKLSVYVSYLFFMRGFIAVGKIYNNYLLKISSYLMVFTFAIYIGFDIYYVIWNIGEELFLFIQSASALVFGAIGIILGVGFVRLKQSIGTIAVAAGAFELIIAFFFLTIVGSFLSMLMLIPAVIVEVIILYKVYESLPHQESDGLKPSDT